MAKLLVVIVVDAEIIVVGSRHCTLQNQLIGETLSVILPKSFIFYFWGFIIIYVAKPGIVGGFELIFKFYFFETGKCDEFQTEFLLEGKRKIFQKNTNKI